jgi:hypothetical protein
MARRQCAKCPWKKSTNPYDIPNGYDPDKHRDLASTVAIPGALPTKPTLRVMACHETQPGKELACVGWLAHQLGPGNNISLRLAAHRRPELLEFELVGEQHETFEATLPKEKP